MPSRKQTTELAADPRPWQRMSWLPGKSDDRMDGEEIRRIAQPPDQPELVGELRLVRRPEGRPGNVAPPPARTRRSSACCGLIPARRPRSDIGRRAGRDRSVQRSSDARRSALDHVRPAREQPRHLGGALQMPVGMALAAEAEFVDRAFLADRGDDVLQHPPVGRMVEDVAGRQRRDARRARHPVEPVDPQPRRPAGAGRRWRNRPGRRTGRRAAPAPLGRLVGLAARPKPRSCPRRGPATSSQPSRHSLLPGHLPSSPRSCGRPAVSSRVSRDQAGPVRRIEEQALARDEIEPAARHQPDPGRLRRLPGPHHAGHAVAIDHAQRRIAEKRRRREQFLARSTPRAGS